MTTFGTTSMIGRRMATLLSIAGAVAAGCNAPRQPATPQSQETARQTSQDKARDAAPGSAQETDQEGIQRLEREARALARTDGCQSGGDCRAAPVGVRPCGGPREYVVYCARTTDSVALYRKLDELARAERAYNVKQGLFSTCEFRTPPRVVASGGSCRAATP
jgi:hypothetical protein